MDVAYQADAGKLVNSVLDGIINIASKRHCVKFNYRCEAEGFRHPAVEFRRSHLRHPIPSSVVITVYPPLRLNYDSQH